MLDRYILSEQVKLFVMAISTLLSVLLLEKVNFLSDLLLGKGASFSDIGKALFYLVPSFLVIAAPLAVLMATLMVFSRMSADNEVTAMRASGVSLYRLMYPVSILALFAFGATLYLSTAVVHESNIAFRKSVLSILKANLNLEIKERRFSSRFKDFLIHVNEKKGQRLYGVFISDSRDSEKPKIIEAKEGEITSNPDTGALIIKLANGVIHTVDKSGSVYQTIAFGVHSLVIDMGDGESANKSFEKEIPHLSIAELSSRADKINQKIAKGEKIKPPSAEIVAIHQKFSAPAGCLALGLLGAPLGVMAHRRGKASGFGLGVMMIVANYVLWMVGQGLGAEGKISPVLGVWAPPIIMGLIGIYLVVRVSKDTMPTKFGLWLAEKSLSLRLRYR